MYDRRSTNLSHRLYEQALACRMRPFGDGTHGFARMVRDLGHSLKKEVKLEVVGESTDVDRDMLEKLEAPLTHLLRNAVDHGIESPEERERLGKPGAGAVRLEARHNAGMLQIIVTDDGAGIDVEVLRQSVVDRKLANAETAGKLSESELFEFLFLPGFSLKATVTEISGRGVGLDVVQNMIKQVRGTVRVSSQPGKGTRFQLQLPLALSVVRTLLVEVAGEPYAFPLAYLNRTVKLRKSLMRSLEGRQYFEFEGRQIGLISVHQILERGDAHPEGDELPVVIVGAAEAPHGIVVDRFLGEHELVVQPLDPRLGKIKDISAGALMEDGSPVLIVDVEDLIRSIDKLITGGKLTKVSGPIAGGAVKVAKRVLVVDDSLTVRELERKILGSRGYEVEVAVDGLDGWNAVRTGHFDLVISDVDMPRMDGIELVTLIKKDANTKSIPVMIVSYKDREEDRRRGLEAGADYYLTKGSFHDETLLHAVTDLIGEPTLAGG
jgi:two-component system sensor histidine kinase and response regulator WspE